MTPRTTDEIRRSWLERLGRPADLDFAFFAVGEVYPQDAIHTVALGELGTGRIAPADALEAVGLGTTPVPVRVARVDEPASDGRGVVTRDAGEAGQVLALVLEHEAGAAIAPGQCLAPAGRLTAATAITADIWLVPPGDLPGSPVEQRRLLRAIVEGRGLDLFVHTRPVAARPIAIWQPELGAEYRLAFDLAHPVAVYRNARFALRYEGLTFGAGFVINSQ